MITKIQVKGFKSIKELEIDLNPVNILIGANGAGKSNFISIFSFLRHVMNKNLQQHVIKSGGADKILHYGKKITQEIEIIIHLKSKNNHRNQFILNLGVSNNTLFIKNVRTKYFHAGSWTDFQDYETNVWESQFANIKHGQAHFVSPRILEYQVYHFHDTSNSSVIKGNANINDAYFLRPDGSNLAAILHYLKENNPYVLRKIELTIKSIAPFFDSFVLLPQKLNPNSIELMWKEVSALDVYFNAHDLSDGTLRFICLATLLLQPFPPSTIIIDEPELGLHPAAINKLSAMIKVASTKSQIIISTQSSSLIDNFETDEIIICDRNLSGSIFNRLREQDLDVWLNDYSLGELWENYKIGAQPSLIP